MNFLKPPVVPPANIVDLRPLRPKQAPRLPPTKPAATKPLAPPKPFGVVARFFLFTLLLVLPITAATWWHRASSVKGDVLGASTDAYTALRNAREAMQQLDSALAEKEFAQAAQSFQQARNEIGKVGSVIEAMRGVLPIASQVRSGKALLEAGENIAVAGGHLTTVMTPFLQPREEGESATRDFAQFLRESQANLEPAQSALEAAVTALRDVKPDDLPEEYRPTFTRLSTALPELTASINRFQDVAQTTLELLGVQRTQRYLVLFQNNLELRATGGFLGSMALIDVSQGSITKLEVPGGGTYDVQGQLSEKVIAPEPLHIVNPHWYLQDANWWPDFPESAKKVVWFYEKSGGPSVDGVIALTPDVVIDLLRFTGPIEVPEPHAVTISAENFLPVALQSIESREEQPKKIIADLLPLLLDRLFQDRSLDYMALLSSFETALREKQMLFYFPDASRQERIVRLGWAGEIKNSPKDYLSVIDTNIGGGKTDGVIDETLHHDATIADDGSVTVTVTVQRTHYGTPNDPFTGTRNIDYIRFYVPKGSTLLSVEGFERIDPKRFQLPEAGYEQDEDLRRVEGKAIVDEATGTRVHEEFGKTVFANWIGVAPGETATASITYRLPFRLNVRRTLFSTHSDEYSLYVQKQPGAKDRVLVSTVRFPASYAIRWVTPTPTGQELHDRTFSSQHTLATDVLTGLVFDPK